MPTRLYRFHCTDGHELVTDLRGSRFPNAAQVRAHCFPGDLSCRPRQRQALLQWAYDPFV